MMRWIGGEAFKLKKCTFQRSIEGCSESDNDGDVKKKNMERISIIISKSNATF